MDSLFLSVHQCLRQQGQKVQGHQGQWGHDLQNLGLAIVKPVEARPMEFVSLRVLGTVL